MHDRFGLRLMQVVSDRHAYSGVDFPVRLRPAVLLVLLAQLGCASGSLALVDDGPGDGVLVSRVSLQSDEPAERVVAEPGRGTSSGKLRAEADAVPADRVSGGVSSGHSLLPRTGRVSARGVSGAGISRLAREGESDSEPGDAGVVAESVEGEVIERSDAEAFPAEGGMLERFRALYSPRPEDGSERLRRQMLRWSDPFGLLKERESGASESGSAELGDAVSGESGRSESDSELAPAVSSAVVVESLIAELEQELGRWPVSSSGQPERIEEWRRKQTDLRLLYCVTGRTSEAARVIDGLPREEQEFWQSMMLALSQYRTAGGGVDRSEQLTEALGQVRAAARSLQPLAKLEIRRLQFCSRIDGFGNVSAFPTADFEPGQRLLLYAGVRNFRSELTSEGRYRSEFAAVVEFLREEDGEVLERIRLPQIPDECDEERTDYFQSFELTAPVLEGNYIVRLQLRDQLTRQTAEARLRMTIR